MAATVSDDALARCRRKKKITTTAMTTTATPPTMPATIKPVFGLLAPVAVEFLEVVVVEGAEEELEAVINTPGDISGLSKKCMGDTTEKRMERGKSTTGFP
jgi:hypothetical protein